MNIHKVAILLFVLMAGTLAYAVTTLTIPPVTIPASPTSSVCNGNLVQTNPTPPGTGTLRFECPADNGAFQVNLTGFNTPTFTLPAGYTGLGYVTHLATDCTNSVSLTLGIAISLNSGDYDLCATYFVAPSGATLASFSLTWAN